jgi:hypothetical protein
MITLTGAFLKIDDLSKEVTNSERNQNEEKPFFDFSQSEDNYLYEFIDKYDKPTIKHFQQGNFQKPYMGSVVFSADSSEGKKAEKYNIYDNKSGKYEMSGNAPRHYMWYSYELHSEPANDGNPEGSTYDIFYNQECGLNLSIDRKNEPDSKYNIMFNGTDITGMSKREVAEDKTTYSVYNTDGTIQKEYVDYKANDNMSGFALFWSSLFGGTPKDEVRTYSENSNKPQVESTQFNQEELQNMFGYFDYFPRQ